MRCHGNDGCPSGDAREGAAGASDVHVTVRVRLVRVIPMLKRNARKITLVKLGACLQNQQCLNDSMGMATRSYPQA